MFWLICNKKQQVYVICRKSQGLKFVFDLGPSRGAIFPKFRKNYVFYLQQQKKRNYQLPRIYFFILILTKSISILTLTVLCYFETYEKKVAPLKIHFDNTEKITKKKSPLKKINCDITEKKK